MASRWQVRFNFANEAELREVYGIWEASAKQIVRVQVLTQGSQVKKKCVKTTHTLTIVILNQSLDAEPTFMREGRGLTQSKTNIT
jgi:hypothetical protein